MTDRCLTCEGLGEVPHPAGRIWADILCPDCCGTGRGPMQHVVMSSLIDDDTLLTARALIAEQARRLRLWAATERNRVGVGGHGAPVWYEDERRRNIAFTFAQEAEADGMDQIVEAIDNALSGPVRDANQLRLEVAS